MATQIYNTTLDKVDWTKPPPMSGFVTDFGNHFPGGDATAIMSSITQEMLPVFETLARQFAVCDSWHCSVPSQTWTNRMFLHAATSHGIVNNGALTVQPKIIEFLKQNPLVTLMEHMDAQKVPGWSWNVYTEIKLLDISSKLFADLFGRRRRKSHPQYKLMHQFHEDAKSGHLPAYSFIEPRYISVNRNKLHNDMHPSEIKKELGPYVVRPPVWNAQELIADIFEALFVNSPAAKKDRTLLIVTFDEHGGTYDHVPPPEVVATKTSTLGRNLPGQPGSSSSFTFERCGVRVPFVMVSPNIKPGTVLRPAAGAVFDHSSIAASILQKFKVKVPLSERQQNAQTFWHVGSAPGSPEQQRDYAAIATQMRQSIKKLEDTFERNKLREGPLPFMGDLAKSLFTDIAGVFVNVCCKKKKII